LQDWGFQYKADGKVRGGVKRGFQGGNPFGDFPLGNHNQKRGKGPGERLKRVGEDQRGQLKNAKKQVTTVLWNNLEEVCRGGGLVVKGGKMVLLWVESSKA